VARSRSETTAGGAGVSKRVNDESALFDRVDAAIETVRPYIRSDGGDAWLIEVAPPVARVQMIGACGGCAMANATLKGAIEHAVRERCPEIERVEQI